MEYMVIGTIIKDEYKEFPINGRVARMKILTIEELKRNRKGEPTTDTYLITFAGRNMKQLPNLDFKGLRACITGNIKSKETKDEDFYYYTLYGNHFILLDSQDFEIIEEEKDPADSESPFGQKEAKKK